MRNYGTCIIADPFIDDYITETHRKYASARLGYETLAEAISNEAPDDILSAMVDVLHNDVLGNEYKTSIKKRTEFLKGIFQSVETYKTWPSEAVEFGDYYQICRGRK